MGIGAAEMVVGVPLAAFVLWLAFPPRVALRWSREYFAADYRAFVDVEHREAFDRAETRDRRLIAAVLTAGVIGAWLAARLLPMSGWTTGVFGVALVLLAAGRLVHAGRELPAPPGATTVARTRAVRGSDYLHPIAIFACVVFSAVASVTAGVAAGNVVSGGRTATAAIGVGGSAAIVGVWALACPLYFEMLCRRPERSVDAADLYVQDAWRSRIMRGELASLFVATMLVSGSASDLDAPTSVTGLKAHTWLIIVLLALLSAALMLSKMRFRRRLWPELGSDGFVLPTRIYPAGGGS